MINVARSQHRIVLDEASDCELGIYAKSPRDSVLLCFSSNFATSYLSKGFSTQPSITRTPWLSRLRGQWLSRTPLPSTTKTFIRRMRNILGSCWPISRALEATLSDWSWPIFSMRNHASCSSRGILPMPEIDYIGTMNRIRGSGAAS